VRLVLRLSLVGLLASVAFAVAGAHATVSPDQLALIPLPKSELGAAAVALPLDPDSGVETNKDAADNAFGNVKAAQLARLGRLTGYTLDYNDSAGKGLAAGHGLLEVQTSVELYRDARAASDGIAFWRKDAGAFARASLPGIKVSFSSFAVAGVGSNAYSFAGWIDLQGKPRIYGAEVIFQVGELLADVSVSAASAAETQSLAVTLTRKLRARVVLARSGKLQGPPVPLPGKVKPGPPPNGLDLSKLALTPADLGANAKVAKQGYKLDKDLSPISDYERELSPAGPFAVLGEQVELFHSPLEAGYTLSAVVAGFSSEALVTQFGAAEFKSAHVASYHVTRLPALHAGDEARGALATITLTNGSTFNMGFVVVRNGSVLETLTATTTVGVRLLPSALADLARIASARAAHGLGAGGTA
jgi:hypothetical protein